MIINVNSHKPQGPWDPDKKRPFDKENALTMLMILVPVLLFLGAVALFGN